MKLFKRSTSDERSVDKDHDEAVNSRMKSVRSRETDHDEASAVEQRLRNMVYGTNKK